MTITNLKTKIGPILSNYGVKKAALFGSTARGEQKPNSDIDLLVSFSKPVDFFELYDLEQKLTKVLNKKVDLVTDKGLNKHIKPYIKPDLQTIYKVI